MMPAFPTASRHKGTTPAHWQAAEKKVSKDAEIAGQWLMQYCQTHTVLHETGEEPGSN
jgi:hypothetical protein